jgi:CRISPR/Cas system-associated endonuclease Cas1
VLTLVNRKMLQDRHFEPGRVDEDDPEQPQGVYLTRRGLRIFFEQYTRRLNTRSLHPLAGRAIEYQKCFEVQARTLRKALEGGLEAYQPFLIK